MADEYTRDQNILLTVHFFIKVIVRLQAVPFWIVERLREIAEREKTGANERRGAWGKA